jgi:hypothetical protein
MLPRIPVLTFPVTTRTFVPGTKSARSPALVMTAARTFCCVLM